MGDTKPSLLKSIVSKPSRATEMLLYRDRGEITESLLDHEGNSVTIHPHKSGTDEYRWKAIYEALRGNQVLFVNPHQSAARGAILLIEDEIERSSLSRSEFGIAEQTNTKIKFDTGGVIHSINGGGPDGDKRVRGFNADFLGVDLWTEDGTRVESETLNDAVIPIADMAAETWAAHTTLDMDNALIEHLLADGCFVIKP